MSLEDILPQPNKYYASGTFAMLDNSSFKTPQTAIISHKVWDDPESTKSPGFSWKSWRFLLHDAVEAGVELELYTERTEKWFLNDKNTVNGITLLPPTSDEGDISDKGEISGEETIPDQESSWRKGDVSGQKSVPGKRKPQESPES